MPSLINQNLTFSGFGNPNNDNGANQAKILDFSQNFNHRTINFRRKYRFRNGHFFSFDEHDDILSKLRFN